MPIRRREDRAAPATDQNPIHTSWFHAPRVSLGVFVLCADTDAAAQVMAQCRDLWRLRVERGEFGPFPSPADWRDQWIYFLLVDRFDNPAAPPRNPPFDGPCNLFQGGTFDGVRRQLDYLGHLGVGAIWLSPVLKNCQYNPATYHGYGIQDFLAIEPRFCRDPDAARRDPRLAEEELRALRIKQANLVGPAGYISMEDTEATEMVQRGTVRDGETTSVMDMGLAKPDQIDTLITESLIRKFWMGYQKLMDY